MFSLLGLLFSGFASWSTRSMPETSIFKQSESHSDAYDYFYFVQ